MAEDDDAAKGVMDAANAAIAGVQTALSDLGDRLDKLAETQAATLAEVVKLRPVEAASDELHGDADALDPLKDPIAHDPPASTDNDPTHEKSPLRRFHEVFG